MGSLSIEISFDIVQKLLLLSSTSNEPFLIVINSTSSPYIYSHSSIELMSLNRTNIHTYIIHMYIYSRCELTGQCYCYIVVYIYSILYSIHTHSQRHISKIQTPLTSTKAKNIIKDLFSHQLYLSLRVWTAQLLAMSFNGFLLYTKMPHKQSFLIPSCSLSVYIYTAIDTHLYICI